MFDLISIVFRPELPLLKIQAESINQYINPDDINSIVVVVNDHDDVAALIDIGWWGQHVHKVKIKCRSEWDYTSRIGGWENQQLCKLLAAAESTCDWSMVLDAKTWFIKKVTAADFFDEQGRARTGHIPTVPVFESSRQFVEQLYNVTLEHTIGPGGVPFIFHTHTVKALTDSIDNFIEFFQTQVKYPNLITEFHLYSGFVLSRYGSYKELYNKDIGYSVINIADWEADNFDQLFAHMNSNNTLLTTVSIHRRAYKDLSTTQIKQWVDFLIEKNLVCDNLETCNLLNTYIK